MANPHRGEADLELDGEKYVIRIDFNAMADIQDETGVSLMDLSSGLKAKGLPFYRKALAAGLSHGRRTVTTQQAGDIFGAHMSDLDRITAAINLAITRFLTGPNPPNAHPQTEANDDDRPTVPTPAETRAES